MVCRLHPSRRALLAPLVVLLLTAPTAAADALDSPAPRRVLFIGNSLTFYNEMPEIVARMARAAGFEPFETARITRGGETFARHVERSDPAAPLEEIAEGKWDVVVLQENGRLAQASSPSSMPPARTLVEAIRRSGAQPLFYMTWAYRERQQDWAKVRATYRRFATHFEADLAPVGIAWQVALRQAPEIDLYHADGIHPSPEGSYLVACVFFAQLFGKSPVGLPRDSEIGVSDEPTRRLQEIAWATVQGFEQPRETP